MYEPSWEASLNRETPLSANACPGVARTPGWRISGFAVLSFRARQTIGLGTFPDWTTSAPCSPVDRAGAGDVVSRSASGPTARPGGRRGRLEWTSRWAVKLALAQFHRLSSAAHWCSTNKPPLVETEHALFERYATAARGADVNPTEHHHPCFTCFSTAVRMARSDRGTRRGTADWVGTRRADDQARTVRGAVRDTSCRLSITPSSGGRKRTT